MIGLKKYVVIGNGASAVGCIEGIRTVDRESERAVTADSRVPIGGAGFMGLKCVEGLHGKVYGITACGLADRVPASVLDGECASVVQKHLEENGISFLLGDSAARFNGSSGHMKSGKIVEFDILITALGSVDFEMLKKLPVLLAFDTEHRRNKLGGVV